MKDDMKPAPENLDAPEPAQQNPIEDPIGDETDGEAQAAQETGLDSDLDSYESEGGPEPESGEAAEEDAETAVRPPAKLERLQKILSQAGIASRRKAEELIEQGRVQVNGQVVSTLGAKADPARDHVRVDGKLLHGAERHRYFMLNKPKGFVTTVSDPEGRPTVMEFFRRMPERLYPVGRLDYLSEGLLLVTNDGELANRLTRAATGVEKTYLVKIAGQPTPEELDRLREGVAIDRGQPGEGRVHTAPAVIRQVRRGDNPWYEVVLIEGRNRELRKMFEEIGHFVEKIRRVGYGPLVLDIEPGKLRELDPDELAALQQVAEGKKRAPKAADARRRAAVEDANLPAASAPRGKSRRDASAKPGQSKPFGEKPFKSGGRAKPYREGARQDRPPARGFQKREFPADESRGEFRPKKSFGKPPSAGRPFRPRPDEESRPQKSFGRPQGERPFRPRPSEESRPTERPARRSFGREEGEGKFAQRPPRADWQKRERPERFDSGEGSRPAYRSRPGAPGAGRGGDRRSQFDRPSQGRAQGERRSDFRAADRPRGTGGRSRSESQGEFRRESGYRPKSGPRFSDAPASGDRPSRPFPRRTEEPGGAKPRGGKSAGAPRGPERRGTSESGGAGPKSRFGGGKSSSGPRAGGRPGSRPSGRTRPTSGPKRPGPGGKRG